MEQFFADRAEQEAEHKGCDYCKPNPYGHGEAIKNLIRQQFNDKTYLSTFIRKDAIHTVYYPTNPAERYSQCCVILYCPMCGRKLEAEQ